ncbi:putative transglutaminase/cysteine protease [Mycobacteroides abscessus subsp. abscessus]|nr:putative transglutaminase/cysteine protease [Mycobacteroides abscessus subsp. abscessus]
MGGEPTFVSIDDQTSEQWTTAADGEHKRARASDLAARLKAAWAPTGLVQRSQGKWYPGEPLPRWQIGLYWRRDGQPLWSDPELLADPWDGERQWSTPQGADWALLSALASDLGLPDSQVRPAYEDPLSRLVASIRRPAGDPIDTADDPAPYEDSAERRTGLLDRLDEAVTQPTAYVLPLHRGEHGWESADWTLRRGRIVLTDGDSPAGLRLPLDAVSWQPAPQSAEADPLSAPAELGAQRSPAPAVVVPAEGAPVTALVAEIRDGLLYLFLPPLEQVDDFVDLIARVEAAVTQPTAYVLPLHRGEHGWESADWTLRRGRIVLTDGDSPAGLRLPLHRGEHGWESADWTLRRGRIVLTDGDSPAGLRLPLHRGEHGWESADWTLRRGRIVLTDGDSPAGLRLPLDAVSWQPAPQSAEADPLSAPAELGAQRSPAPAVVVPAEGAPVTALVAEIRDGLLYLFLPPLEQVDDFVDLIARVEAAVTCPLVIEGYGPPPDPRIEAMSITPDPGVIEVNVTPTASFAEQSRQLQVLYEEARKARLTTESFDVDGTHTGTGGGNHITLGGRTPATSPLLRRPDLLVSLLTYWQHHPALSYLFSGRFVGTTSQAPRVDEGREEALYELEIAFAEIERLADSEAPWHIDRSLRHLLTDITGNTHRAEFCIDKLYSPDSARGRLGLLELRGFEMPPHFQMAMVQSLLVRALVARFWAQPLSAPLIRHGANLHGRYLLPHFIIHDIAQVAADLRAHDIAFETSWLDPFTEFRFPRIGTAVFDGIEIELRGAIEPWRVLGEEATSGGTARYVDSSIERVQVRVIGADRSRYVVTCNGEPIPLLSTENPDVQVAGVRYRAWQPPSALHPSITVDDPLRFELIDTANALSRGGCTYHVSHPGGRSYDDPPVNAVAAEARRGRRFDATGYTTGRVDLSDLREKQARMSTDAVAPGILDLRRARTVGRR